MKSCSNCIYFQTCSVATSIKTEYAPKLDLIEREFKCEAQSCLYYQSVSRMEFYELLEKIEQRPQMYLGGACIHRLYAFICGYNVATWDVPSKEKEHFADFGDWVLQTLNVAPGNSWDRAIAVVTEEPLKYFFQLLDQYKNKFPIV
ncbi:hypothetical protein OsccyDRAFT_0604 [Leptolyngbyaceae cyanobacterium JSC-12]|nr:hypothetical protein OsccyDRAFT_0604 [Leptolyngbyaceae cyanobacterium JSC-12]